MKMSSFEDENYVACISDLLKDKDVWSMAGFIQHSNVSCIEHSFSVSYASYRICKKFGLDYQSAARGALLHDFFLYDWHNGAPGRLHALKHPNLALKNATNHFNLNSIEKEIIKRHMWPLTITPPIHKEAIAVVIADKYCASLEILRGYKRAIFK